MGAKTVKHYAVLSYPDGTQRINIYFTDGTENSFTNLEPGRARLILDILKNEKPVYWTEDAEILWTGREPLGEKETVFNLDGWLSERPWLRNNILWQYTDGSILSYDQWSNSKKASLRNTVSALMEGRPLGIQDPPPLAVIPSQEENTSTKLSQSTAWQLFVAHAAQSIVVESSQYVPWTLNELNSEELRQLFDSRSLFQWDNTTSTYVMLFGHGVATPGDPTTPFKFLKSQNLVKSNRIETIHRLLGWCRENLIHFLGGWSAENVYNQWQYYGFPPIVRMLEGTPDNANPGSPIRHRTGGCWGTTGFLRAVLRTINIPVKLVTRAGHAQPHFIHENLFLSHGDDPYNAMMRAVPPVPIELLPIDQTVYNSWFGPSVPAETVADNIGRKSIELGLEYLSNWLLQKRCADLASGASHVDGGVFGTLRRFWSLEELEAMDLWNRLDAKIESFGGCDSIPP